MMHRVEVWRHAREADMVLPSGSHRAVEAALAQLTRAGQRSEIPRSIAAV